jgi:hypothetical protein
MRKVLPKYGKDSISSTLDSSDEYFQQLFDISRKFIYKIYSSIKKILVKMGFTSFATTFLKIICS